MLLMSAAALSLTESTGVDEYSGKDFAGEIPMFSNGQEGVARLIP